MKKEISTVAFTLILFFVVLTISGQVRDTCPVRHTMAPCEARLKAAWNRDFTITPPPVGPVRMIAEFEEMQSVLIRYPFEIPMSLIVEMAEDCNVTTIVQDETEEQTVIGMYLFNGIDTANCEFLHAPTNSQWTRDYGPWFVADGSNEVGICDFPYNRPRPDDDDIPVVLAAEMGLDLYGMPLEHTGGNWMCDGISNASSTELVWEENPGLSHDSIDNLVQAYLGIQDHHVLSDPLGEYIQHIDCWGKFLDVDKVLIGEVPPSDSRYDDFEFVADYFAQNVSAWGNYYQVYRVFTPGNYPYTPYTNSLILNKKVLVPLTGSTHDDDALQVYEEAMPGYEVIGIDYDYWYNTDALHCRTKGIADTGMLHIDHLPLLGYKDFMESWVLEAEISSYCSAGLIPDSLIVSYMVDNSSYQNIPLTNDTLNIFSAEIPFQFPGSEIAYFIHAADSTGRMKDHPYIGQYDPHVFQVDTLPCVWTGNVSASWTDPLNWHDQRQPGAQDKVFVLDTVNFFPEVTGSLCIGGNTGDFNCKELIVRSGSSLTANELILETTGHFRVDDGGSVFITGSVGAEKTDIINHKDSKYSK